MALFYKLCTLVLICESVTKQSDCYLGLKTEQWKIVEDLVPILEQLSVATTFFNYEKIVSISSVFAIVYGLLNYLEASSSDSKKWSEMETYASGDGGYSPVHPKKQKLTALDKLLGPDNLTLEPPTFEMNLKNT